MKKILSKIIAPISCFTLATPIIFINTSCEPKHTEIESIKLSSRYSYIYPDNQLKIKATVSPASASKSDLQWEIIDENQLGFSIDEEGWLSSPKTYPTDEPFSIFIKCSSKLNPEVNAIYSVLGTTDTEHELLGFAGGITYLNRDGSIGTREIKYKYIVSGSLKTKVYYIEGADPEDDVTQQDGIDLYVGRSDEYVDFKPVFKTGNNDGMRFDLTSPYGELDEFNCVSWIGYKDNDVTRTIPQFAATDPTYRKQFMDVTFTADSNIVFRIVFDVFKDEKELSPVIFNYNPTPKEGQDWQGENEHTVNFVSDGTYESQILANTTTGANSTKRVGDIYLYRKPFENVKILTARWEPNPEAPDIFTSDGKPQFTDLEFGHHLPGFDWYDIAIVRMTYTVDRNKAAALHDYDKYYIGRYRVYDIDDKEYKSPLGRIEFYVSWIQ